MSGGEARFRIEKVKNFDDFLEKWHEIAVGIPASFRFKHVEIVLEPVFGDPSTLKEAARKCIADIHEAAETTHDAKIDGQVFKALEGLKAVLEE